MAASEAFSLDLASLMCPVDPALQLFTVPGWYVWCPSPIRRPQGGYYLFYSRWPHGSAGREGGPDVRVFDGWRGWLYCSQIAVAYSDHALGPYRHLRTILASSGDPRRWDCFTAHNPMVKVFDGKAYLYYISTNPRNTSPEHRVEDDLYLQHQRGQRIGVVVADSLEDLACGRGRRSDAPLITPDGTTTFRMAVNASVTESPAGNGHFLMMYKSADAQGRMVTAIATSDEPDRGFRFRSLALSGERVQIEDPYVWFDPDRRSYFAVMKDYYAGTDRSGALSPEWGSLCMLESADGLAWDPASSRLVSRRKLALVGGTTCPLALLERPSLLFDDGRPVALFAAMAFGPPDNDADDTGRFTSYTVAIPLAATAELASEERRMSYRQDHLPVGSETSSRRHHEERRDP